jgi:hypothetical protein
VIRPFRDETVRGPSQVTSATSIASVEDLGELAP